MFDELYRRCIGAGLIGGTVSPNGWGRVVRDQVLPLLEHPKLRHHAGIIREGFDRAAAPTSVFVIGEGKFGKSSLINAFVRAPVAFVDFLPATWHITRYLPANPQTQYQIHYDASAASAGHFEDQLRTLRLHSDWQAGTVRFANIAQLEQVMAAEEARLKKSKGHSPVTQVVRTLPANAVAAHLEIVDTPGLAQLRNGMVGQETLDDFYHRADVVLWLLVADKLNSANTREALQAQARYGKPIVAVVNRADLLKSAEQRQRVEEEVRHNFGDLLHDIVLVSARNAFLLAQQADEAGYAASGLPRLWEVVERLAIVEGPRTKALSLYNTSRQAAHEAAGILRQEADILKENLNRYRKNCDCAGSFTERGNEVVRTGTSGAAHQIVLRATPVMQRTANFRGADHEKVFDETAVRREIESVAQNVIEQLNERLRRELSTVQDEIATRHYLEQSYGGDARVKAHSSATSFALQLDNVAHNIAIPAIPPVATLFDSVVGVVADFVDWAKIKWYEAWGETARVAEIKEAGRVRRREQEHENYVRGLPQAAEQIVEKMREAARRAVAATTRTLTEEVRHCFDGAFGGEEAARANVKLYRRQADGAVVPPPLLTTLTRVLRGAS